MPITLQRPRGSRRWVLRLLIFAAVASGLVAVSRATDPQEGQKGEVATPASPSDVEIRSLLKALTIAYNQADAKGLAAVFTDDAILFGPDGDEVRGRDAIGRHYGEAFDSGPMCKIADEVEAVHFLSPEVASAIGHFHLDDEKGTALFSGRYSLIAVRKQNQWKLAELRDLATTRGDPADKRGPLRELEWLVGEWVDEGEGGRSRPPCGGRRAGSSWSAHTRSKPKGNPKRAGRSGSVGILKRTKFGHGSSIRRVTSAKDAGRARATPGSSRRAGSQATVSQPRRRRSSSRSTKTRSSCDRLTASSAPSCSPTSRRK